MSKFSGKCDLYDHVFSIGSKGTTDDMSDLEKFEIFKKRTGGKLYQRFPLKLTKYNIDSEIRLVNNPDILSKNDDGTYTYWLDTYKTLNKLNKHGYYATREIRFDDILDLVPYFPYIISSMAADQDGETIYISSKDYLSLKEDEARECGLTTYDCDLYRKFLKEELINIVKRYY